MSALIISFIIPLLIWGPFFPDLIVSLSSLVFFIYIIRKKKFYYFNNKVLIIFFIFCIYCILVSILVAKNTLLSFESSLFYFRIGIFSCLIWYSIDNNKKILSYFYYSLVFCFAVLIVDGYIQFISGVNIIGLSKLEARVSSFFGNELILGSYLSRLFPLLFALFLLKKKKTTRVILYDHIIYSAEWFDFCFWRKSCFFFICFVIYIYNDFCKAIYKAKNNIISLLSNINISLYF